MWIWIGFATVCLEFLEDLEYKTYTISHPVRKYSSGTPGKLMK